MDQLITSPSSSFLRLQLREVPLHVRLPEPLIRCTVKVPSRVLRLDLCARSALMISERGTSRRSRSSPLRLPNHEGAMSCEIGVGGCKSWIGLSMLWRNVRSFVSGLLLSNILRFLLKLRDRIERVGIDLPTIEVRYENLNIEAEANVGNRGLPTILNSFTNTLEMSYAYGAPLTMEDRERSSGNSRYSLVASKQMVGIFLTVWVRSDTRDYVKNIKVSCIGRGLMGYLGNKGSISISMSLHQTSFCFICSHLTSGEKEGDELRRNFDVMEILKKTRFPRVHGQCDDNSPETILEHDRIIWLGDLNYRIALSYRSAKALVEMHNW